MPLDRLRQVLERSTAGRPVRFLLTGALNTAFGLAVYSALVLAGTPVPGALALSLIAGIVFNFVTMGRLVFRMLRLALVVPFVAAYGAVYLFNLGLLGLIQPLLGSAILAQLIAAGPVAVLSYGLLSRFVFVPRRVGRASWTGD